jgi:hypothetical protein
MRVVEAPNHAHIGKKDLSVFLGGGITNCPEWQAALIDSLTGTVENNIVLLNPRRAKFDVSDASASVTQIQWEFDYLKRADVKLFWFPQESICPITLFELGKELATDPTKLVVGCSANYSRMTDIEIQSRFHDVDVIRGFDYFCDKVQKVLWSKGLEKREKRF